MMDLEALARGVADKLRASIRAADGAEAQAMIIAREFRVVRHEAAEEMRERVITECEQVDPADHDFSPQEAIAALTTSIRALPLIPDETAPKEKPC